MENKIITPNERSKDPKIYSEDMYGHVFKAPCWTGTYVKECSIKPIENCNFCPKLRNKKISKR